MVRTPLNAGWTVQPNLSVFSQLGDTAPAEVAVTLPHDAMLGMARDADAGSANGYFPGGSVAYLYRLEVPEAWRDRRVTLEFDGVYRDAMVYVDGVFAAQRPHGYTRFQVALDPFLSYGGVSTIRVEARAHLDTRWYSGLGIHRECTLVVTALEHLGLDEPRVSTPDVDDAGAVVEVRTDVVNEGHSTRTLRVAIRLLDGQGDVVAADTVPVTVRAGETAVVRRRLYLATPTRWSPDLPYLYSYAVELGDENGRLDSRSGTFGVRTLQVDPVHGLRINGEVVKLRGACVHHDNGILGAAAIARAEVRRVELLRAAGFNAIRASHNPLSPAMLDACDRLGVLVVDEAFDMWTVGKQPFDYSLAFTDWWERDVASMIAKDHNHPSVIIYSIGNEILDAGRPLGAAIGRRIAERVRELDDSRFVTNAVSGFVATVSELVGPLKKKLGAAKPGGVNAHMAVMQEFSLSAAVTERTAETHSVVDIVGHNYADQRYLLDREAFPGRVVVGTETLAKRIDIIWGVVLDNPHVIGDFTWTGWDYLGEAGLGAVSYFDDVNDVVQPSAFPALLSGAGDIDITGYRRAASYYRETVFGLRSEPYIAVRRPAGYGRRVTALEWAFSDALSTWDWDLDVGSPVAVEVYSDAAEVELLLNGVSVGSAAAGRDHRFRAEFDIAFEPGELVAVARTAGVETGRSSLRSVSGPVRLVVTADRSDLAADDADLAYLDIELRDERGTLRTSRDVEVQVDLAGPGVLQGFGSARPAPLTPFGGTAQETFEGRVQAIIRPRGVGEITVTVSSEGFEPVVVSLNAAALADRDARKALGIRSSLP